MWDNCLAVDEDRSGLPPSATNTKGAAIEQDELNIMSDSNTNMASAINNAKAAPAGKKAKAAPQAAKAAAPAPRAVTQQARAVVTFATAARVCANEGVATRISRLYGLDEVDYHAVREAHEEHLVKAADALAGSLNDKALEMHLQRIVDAYVRSAHGAGNFYDGKAAIARQLTSAIANEDRDEDRPGIDGTENKAQRACEFAAQVGLQSYALLAAAHGAIDAYAHVTGQDWKPYEGMQAPSQGVTRQAVAIRAAAFDKE